MELEYKIALAETGLSLKQLPKEVLFKINSFNLLRGRAEKQPDNLQLQNQCHAEDSLIADLITDFYENDFEETPNNQNNNNMTKEQEALIARAKAVGLPETATETEIAAKELEAKTKENADAAKAKADAEAAAEAEKNKSKAPVETDVFDDLDL